MTTGSILICLALVSGLLMARETKADNTLRGRRLKVEPTTLSNEAAAAIAADTVFDPTGLVLAGYDKPLTAAKETLLITNNTGDQIAGLGLTMTYLDLSGRELHSTHINLDVDLPAGATRRVSFPSWDIQKSYYYHLGKKPRTANVTPYKVRCHVDYYLIPHQSKRQ